MSQMKKTDDKPKKKAPYRKPAVVCREPLQAVAGQCTPSPALKASALDMCSTPFSS